MNGPLYLTTTCNRKTKHWYYLLLVWTALVLHCSLSAQDIEVPAVFHIAHPRLPGGSNDKANLQRLVQEESWAKDSYQQLKQSVDPYVTRHQTDTAWIVSRLQMYWKTHATDVFIKGGVYDHAEGYAPVPTVRFTGTRDAVSVYAAPEIEDIQPCMDDPRGLLYVNTSLPGKPLEWAPQARTGRVVEAINRQLMNMAQTAAFVYWISGEEKYARFAFDLFNAYMNGMYYRKEPYDLNHSHNQTLVGLSSFEVIHEDILNELAGCYDFLYNYIKTKAAAQIPLYDACLKKWADLILKNGVPFNNWDLIEARFVMTIALLLQNDADYSDGKGMHYYLDFILNRNMTRQWSLRRLVQYGYDAHTGIWAECPGYSMNVVNDFMSFVSMFDRILHIDLFKQLPVLQKAVLGTAQYMFPNGYIAGFGDTHYTPLATTAIRQAVENAQKNHKPGQEALFTAMLKMVDSLNAANAVAEGVTPGSTHSSTGSGIAALLNRSSFRLSPALPAGNPVDCMSASFYAPNVSFLVQRNGLDYANGLMVTQSGSLGNHAHANGISIELYGKGIVLAPDGGIGTSYFQPDYAEYYAQFPAHNTVVVDGISAYPVMKSNHGYAVKSCYPLPSADKNIFPLVNFADLYFLEPETNAGQNRLTGIIRTSDSSGYYVDIFRSARKDQRDKRHDYFYHNLGQQLVLTDPDDHPLQLQPTTQLSFADGDQFGYDYLWNKQSVQPARDIKATYHLAIPGRKEVQMHVWMKGEAGREIFSVKAPPSKAFRNSMIPDSIASLPLLTLVSRQTGEAWSHPFVAVYEPSVEASASVKAVHYFNPDDAAVNNFTGIAVQNKTGSTEYIFATPNSLQTIRYRDKQFSGTYAVISEDTTGVHYLFLGNGSRLSKGGYCIAALKGVTAAGIVHAGNGWFVHAEKPIRLSLPIAAIQGKSKLLLKTAGQAIRISGKKARINNAIVMQFMLPALPYTKMIFQ